MKQQDLFSADDPFADEPRPAFELRPYQKECVSKIVWSKGRGLEGNELIVLPTGAGKSLVIAAIAKELGQPILILQPSKEILEQNREKLSLYVDPEEIGVYSASMNERTIRRYTLATIQSIYRKPELFKGFGLIIIDEAHLLDPTSLEGMFKTFINGIGNPKVIGMTATPYRMASMYFDLGNGYKEVAGTIKIISRMKGLFWNRVMFNINVSDLIEQGFLCPLEYVDCSLIEHQYIPTNAGKTDFDIARYEESISNKESEILNVIEHAESISKSVLVFCSSVSQAEKLSSVVPGSACVSAKTDKKERERIILDFKSGKTKTVFNMGVLTTGFDHPSLDAIVLIRPTRSVALYYQMLGRGVRKSPEKTVCRVFDLSSNVRNLGKIETIKLIKREKWELESVLDDGTIKSWHNTELYRFVIEPKKRSDESDDDGISGIKDRPVKNSHLLDALNSAIS